MLKLYKNTITGCVVAMTLVLFISVMCEQKSFPHVTIIQNCAIGITCSLLVAIFTTLLQYWHEHKKCFDEYCSSLRHLVFVISMAQGNSDEEKPGERFYEKLFEMIDTAMEDFNKKHKQLCWFNKEKSRLQDDVFMAYGKNWIAFEHYRFESHRKCVEALNSPEEFAALVKAMLSIYPDDFSKEYLTREYESVLNQEVTTT